MMWDATSQISLSARRLSPPFSPFVDVEAVVLDYLLPNPPTVTSYTHQRFRGFHAGFATNAELIFYARREPSPSLPNVDNPRGASILHSSSPRV